jgi:anti-sigma factor RsiW
MKSENHISEEQLTLHYYGDAERAPEVEAHLRACAECRRCFERLKSVLAEVEASPEMAVPPRGEDYAGEVWRALEPKLGAAPRRAWWRMDWSEWRATQRWATAGALAAMLLGAFLLGRISHTPTAPEEAVNAEQVRERILLVAVGEHLERSQMVLVELSNASKNGTVNISNEQRAARELVGANRLYRQTAASAGQQGLAGALEELERSLIEIANSPPEVSSAELARLQRRLEAQGILFKVRVLGSQVEQRAKPPLTAPAEKNRT